MSLTASLTRSGVQLLPFERLYTGSEPDGPHALALAADGSLIRARNQSGTLYLSRVSAPSSSSVWNTWSNLTPCTAAAGVALAARPGEVLLAYVDSAASTRILLRTSTDNGSSWSAPTSIVTEASAIGSLALAFNPFGDACLFYTLGTSTTLKRLRRTSGVWAASGANWSRSASVASLTGISALHDGADFILTITGTEVTTGNPRAWAAFMGDLLFPANAWSTLAAIAEADAASSITFAAPGIAYSGSYRASFVRKEAGSVAENRVYTSNTPQLGSANGSWFEPAPHQATGTAGLALAAASSAVWGTTPAGVWYAPLAAGQDLSSRLIRCSLRITPASTRATIELDDADGVIAAGNYAAVIPGATLTLAPGYASGAAGATENGVVFMLIIDRVTSAVRRGRRLARIEASGAWELAQRWHAPQAWQSANGALARSAIFARFAIRAGLSPSSAGIPYAPSADWTGNKPPFVVPAGESAASLMARLLAPMPELVRPEAGLQVVGTSASDAATGAYGAAGQHPIAELELSAEAWQRNWTRLAGSGRYADTFDPAQVYVAGPRFGVLSDATAVDNSQAANWAAAILRKQQMLTPRGQLVAPFDCARQLLDVVTVTDGDLAAAGDYRVIGLGMEYSRGPRPRFDSILVLGGK